MRLSISGIHMDTGNALRDHTEQRLAGLTKYFDQVIDVNVGFVQEGHHQHLHSAEVAVHASGVMLHAEGDGPDWFGAIDEATAKLERQLERYKGRLHKHREQRQKYAEKVKSGVVDGADGMAFESLRVSDDALEDGFDGAVDGARLDAQDRAMLSELAPTVVRKDVSQVAPMTVDEAVMQMDLLHKPAFLFLNKTSGQLNMVYRENDKAIRWVAPRSVG